MLEIILKQIRAILKDELRQSVQEINRELRAGEAFIRSDLALLRTEFKKEPPKLLQQERVPLRLQEQVQRGAPRSFRNR